MKIKRCAHSRETIILSIIFILAFLSRFWFLAEWPDGALPDEAYGAYNAYGLMTEGMDSRGYSFPVYFVAWGSGMSVLYSYLAIPFFKILGVCLWAYRLPQAIVSFCSVIAIYILCKELFSKKMGMFLAFVLAVNPWSIMNARFGLDANMAPGMFVIGFCFLILGIRKSSKYMILAAIFMGLTLYCYALSWIMVPLFLVLCLVFYWKYIPFDRYTWIAIGFLFLIALPLILFLAINWGFMPEIRTEFISIPRLASFRGDEMSFSNIISSLKDTIKTVIFQYDGASHTSSKVVGAYYFFTTPFFVFGVIYHWVYIIRNFKLGRSALESIWLLWLISAMVICVLNANITTIHINLIHLPVVFYGGYGIWKFVESIDNFKVFLAINVFYVISFVVFMQDYVTTEQTYFFGSKTNEVLETAKELVQEEESIYIYQVSTIKYSNLLWHELPSVSDFYEKVVYDSTSHPAWQEMLYYDGFGYITDVSQATDEGVYIMPNQFAERFQLAGFKIKYVNSWYSIGWR